MINVLLVGDSIRLGYQSKVAELLGSDVKIYAPAENCRFTKFALWGMFAWMEEWGNPRIDAVHWNTGIWDLHRCTADGELFSSVDEYVRDNIRLARQMASYSDKLIWANIIPGGRGLDKMAGINALINTEPGMKKINLTDYQDKWNADVVRYNKAAEKALSEMGVHINDLYSLMAADTDRFISDDGIHPTGDGYDVLARKVADEISALIY